MKRIMIFPLLILCWATLADAEIYTWTDAQGVVTFTDNPASFPGRISGKTRSDEIVSVAPPAKALKGLGKRGTRLHATIPGNRVKSAAAVVQQKQLALDRQSEVKGHLGGDQTDPAPPSMKQPIPLPVGDQPKTTDPGMKQPEPLPLGDQPRATPAGMKQPKAESTGTQPPPTSSGMEQPDSKK